MLLLLKYKPFHLTCQAVWKFGVWSLEYLFFKLPILKTYLFTWRVLFWVTEVHICVPFNRIGPVDSKKVDNDRRTDSQTDRPPSDPIRVPFMTDVQNPKYKHTSLTRILIS